MGGLGLALFVNLSRLKVEFRFLLEEEICRFGIFFRWTSAIFVQNFCEKCFHVVQVQDFVLPHKTLGLFFIGFTILCFLGFLRRFFKVWKFVLGEIRNENLNLNLVHQFFVKEKEGVCPWNLFCSFEALFREVRICPSLSWNWKALFFQFCQEKLFFVLLNALFYSFIITAFLTILFFFILDFFNFFIKLIKSFNVCARVSQIKIIALLKGEIFNLIKKLTFREI